MIQEAILRELEGAQERLQAPADQQLVEHFCRLVTVCYTCTEVECF